MKKILLFVAFANLNIALMMAQTNKTFFLGHSLVNFDMPNMVNKLSIAGAKAFSYNVNIINGAPLVYHWNNPTSGQGSPWKTTLPQGGLEHFIVTEAVPLLGHLQYSNTYRIADSLYQFAKLQNPNIKYYIYETWHCNTTGTPAGCPWDNDDALLWRQRLTADLPKWEGIADSMNLIYPDDMLVIPAGQALARLSDNIIANAVPGFTSTNQLFSDDIHLTNIGNYFIASLIYGVIHKVSPVGLPNQLTDVWGVPYAVYPTNAQAQVLQRIAWETLCFYPRDGIDCAIVLPIDNLEFSLSNIGNKEVELYWKTTAEKNNDYFTLEKSNDAINWTIVSKIKSMGNAIPAYNYSATDKAPYYGNSYYRLKQTGLDGNFTYSKILSINITKKAKINIYPNPATATVHLVGDKIENLKLYTTEGRDITNEIQINLLNSKVTLNLINLSNGLYILKANGQTLRIIKNDR